MDRGARAQYRTWQRHAQRRASTCSENMYMRMYMLREQAERASIVVRWSRSRGGGQASDASDERISGGLRTYPAVPLNNAWCSCER